MIKIRFVRQIQVAQDAYSLYFERPARFDYQPGQYIELLPEFGKMDERGEKRWFTLSSSPTEKQLTITTRHVKTHPSSFKDALFALKAGDEISIKGPSGDFLLPTDDHHIIWIAGGIGVTPFRSQTKYLLDSGIKKSITLIHSNRTRADIVFGEIFAQAQKQMPEFQLIQTLTDESPDDWAGQTGFISDQMITSAGDISTSHIYLSGPEPMVDAFKPRLLDLGANEQLLHQDWFPGYKDKF